jgi:hypothetical protein
LGSGTIIASLFGHQGKTFEDYLFISKLDTIWQTSNIGYFQEEGVK